MKKLSEYIVKISGPKSFGLALFVYLVYAIGVMGLGAEHISELAGNKTEILDLQMTGYNMDTVSSILSVYNPDARAFYVRFSLIADSVYPFVYTFLYIVMIAWALKASGCEYLLQRHLHLLPLATLLLDFAENISIVALVSDYPQHTLLQVQTASAFTLLKWGSVGVQSLLLLWILIKLVRVKFFSSAAK
jgi:hypothetical protein